MIECRQQLNQLLLLMCRSWWSELRSLVLSQTAIAIALRFVRHNIERAMREAEHHAVMWGDVGLTEMLWAYDGYVVWENQHSRRRDWRSKTSHTSVTELTVDGWIKTTNTLQHWLAWRETLRHPLVRSTLLQQHRASAGSLAVILQPAFVHFFGVLVITLLFDDLLLSVLLEKLPVDFVADV